MICMRTVFTWLAVFMILPCSQALVQDGSMSAPNKALGGAAIWPDEERIKSGFDLIVVTVAEPRVRRKCQVQSLDSDHLVCSRHFGRKSVTFDRSELAAIILPGGRVNPWLANPICAAFAGGSIYGAVVLTGISVLTTVGVVAMAVVVTFDAFFYGALVDSDRSADSLIYLRPGEQLQVELK